MRCFQIIKGQVLILNDKLQYDDTIDRYRQINGITSILYEDKEIEVESCIYDDVQECAVINNNWLNYPIQGIEDIINNVQSLIDAKAELDYVPPTLEQLKETKLGDLTVAKNTAFHSTVSYGIYEFKCNDTEYQTLLNVYSSATESYVDVQTRLSGTKVIATFTKEELASILDLINVRRQSLNLQYQDYLSAINSAETKEDLDAIEFDFQ